jgi:hypothetical protein
MKVTLIFEQVVNILAAKLRCNNIILHGQIAAEYLNLWIPESHHVSVVMSACALSEASNPPPTDNCEKETPRNRKQKGTLFSCDIKKGLFATTWPCF